MKIIYNKANGQSTLLFSDDDLYDKEKYTEIKPNNELYQPIKFVDGEWVGTPKEIWEKEIESQQPMPQASEQDLINSQLMLENAQLKEMLNQLQEDVAQLTLQIAGVSK
ncbi:hypothetical protein OXR01_13325 [Staphylococcus gallinarum]|uniref:hypothetical protein n=1 Tax=Staphylococcus gallinarum TaxID=1293 RepID=UPI0022815516|nr:hypothetical protein [Staphylococcus gallinarum]MDN6414870.1 hypothetical protein [Staphylococcus gallinarum]